MHAWVVQRGTASGIKGTDPFAGTGSRGGLQEHDDYVGLNTGNGVKLTYSQSASLAPI